MGPGANLRKYMTNLDVAKKSGASPPPLRLLLPLLAALLPRPLLLKKRLNST